MTEGDRYTNKLWTELCEKGDYTVNDIDITNCHQCGAKQVECQVLRSDSGTKPDVAICFKCGGMQE